MPSALQDLAIMREEAGDLDAASRLFLMSANAGEPAALKGLARSYGNTLGTRPVPRGPLRQFGLDAEGNIASQWAIVEISS